MTLICLASQKGSPGATVTALAVAAALKTGGGRRKVMVEADCTGGTLAIRYRLPVEPGLLTLAAAVRAGLSADGLWPHTQELPGGLPIVVCPDGPDQVHAAMSASGPSLGRYLNRLPGVDVICDVGRLFPDSPAVDFVAEATALLMVARPTAEQLQPAARRMMSLRPKVGNVGWVLVGEKPHGPAEVEATFGFPVVGVVADDQRAVARLEQGLMSKRIRRSPFVRSSATLATTLSNWLGPVHDAANAEPPAVPAPEEAGGVGRRSARTPAPPHPEAVGHPPSDRQQRARSTVDGHVPDVALTGVPAPSAPVPEPPSSGRPESTPAAANGTRPPVPPRPPVDLPPPAEFPPPRPAPGPAATPPRPSPSPVPPVDQAPPHPFGTRPVDDGPVDRGPLDPVPPSLPPAEEMVDLGAFPPPAYEPTPPPHASQHSGRTTPTAHQPDHSTDAVPSAPPTRDPRASERDGPESTDHPFRIGDGDDWDDHIFTRTIDFDELLGVSAGADDDTTTTDTAPASGETSDDPSAEVQWEGDGPVRRTSPPSPFPHEDVDGWGRR